MHNVSPARAAALAALTRWSARSDRQGAPDTATKAEDIFAEESGSARLDRRDRALALDMFYGVIRNLARLDYSISAFVSGGKRKVDTDIRDVLRIAAYQLVFLDRVPAHAAVNEAVEQAKKLRGKGAGSFVNAVLRSMIRSPEKAGLPDKTVDPAGYLSLAYSFPKWIVNRWLSRFGPDGAEALMAASNKVPPLTLRTNTLKVKRDGLLLLMKEAGIGCSPGGYAPDSVVVEAGNAVHELPGYADGLFSVQDEASQLVSLLLDPRPGDRVLDACAAPGGKTAHIAALAGGSASIVASDIGLDKSRLMNENMARLGIGGVSLLAADAALELPVQGQFDRILLDAPCSALGIIRRRPEVKHLRTEPDVARLAGMQARMLQNVSRYMKPGGVLVYSTCSTEPDEGERVVEAFLEGAEGFASESALGYLPVPAHGMATGKGYMRSYPHTHGTDGFFAARIRRKA